MAARHAFGARWATDPLWQVAALGAAAAGAQRDAGATGGAAAPAAAQAAPQRAGMGYLDPRNWPQYRQPTRQQFLNLLKRGDKNALAFVAAGAPRIDARFAAKVAAQDPATLAFVAAHQQPPVAQPSAGNTGGVAAPMDAEQYIENLRRLAGA